MVFSFLFAMVAVTPWVCPTLPLDISLDISSEPSVVHTQGNACPAFRSLRIACETITMWRRCLRGHKKVTAHKGVEPYPSWLQIMSLPAHIPEVL